LVASVFTADRGKVRAVGKGARRSSSKLVGHLEPLTLSRLSIARGRELTAQRPRELQQALSELLATAYSKAPNLHNELLNRQKLSSQAARARRDLIERIFHGADQERLGITGTPPEYSMYVSMLDRGGFHRKLKRDGWKITATELGRDWRPAWRKVERFVRETRDERRPLADLFRELEARPFGLRRGPLPVLAAILLKIRGARLALYEDGLFVPEVGVETMERLIRRPETFEIRTFELRPEEKAVVARLARQADIGASLAGRSSGLLAVVRRLVRMAAGLPVYSRRTRRISRPAIRVRDLLLTAQDPRQLLLEELPEALDVDPAGNDGPKRFAAALGAAVRELVQAWPSLLDEVEEQIREALGFGEKGEELRGLLQQQARRLLPYASENRARLFLDAAARSDQRAISAPAGSALAGISDDWRYGVALALGDGLPPDRWGDEMVERARLRLNVLRRDLDDLEAMARLADGSGGAAGSGPPVASIRLRRPGHRERHVVFPCPAADRKAVDGLVERWLGAARDAGSSPGVQMQALAALTKQLEPLLDGPGRAAGELAVDPQVQGQVDPAYRGRLRSRRRGGHGGPGRSEGELADRSAVSEGASPTGRREVVR